MPSKADADGDEWDADRVRELREREGLSQMGLAQEIGVSKSSVEFWEMGRRTPSDLNRRKLRELEQSTSDDWLLADSLTEAIEALREAAADSSQPADAWYAEQLEEILEQHTADERELEGVQHG